MDGDKHELRIADCGLRIDVDPKFAVSLFRLVDSGWPIVDGGLTFILIRNPQSAIRNRAYGHQSVY
jgi:hypothetical protein